MLLPQRDVVLDRHEVCCLAGSIQDGRDRLLFDIQRVILAAVDEFTLPNVTDKDRSPHLFVEAVWLLARPQQIPQLLTDTLCFAVACEARKCRVDRLNNAVAVGDDDGVGRRRERGALEFASGLRSFVRSFAFDQCALQADLFLQAAPQQGIEQQHARNDKEPALVGLHVHQCCGVVHQPGKQTV